MSTFSADVVAAVLHHMNDDHRDDSVVIVRAFAGVEPSSASMTDLDEHGGTWRYTVDGEEQELRMPWSTELTERPQLRREIVMMYRAACDKLGIPFSEH